MRRAKFVSVAGLSGVAVFVAVIAGLLLFSIVERRQHARLLDAAAHGERGDDWIVQGQFDKAVSEYTEAIKLSSGDVDTAGLYHQRGYAWASQGDSDRAIADLNEAIRLRPISVRYYTFRGVLWKEKKQFDKALADFTEAIRINPTSAPLRTRRAWLWATCSDDCYRDGPRAVEDAKLACELTDYQDLATLNTLAAAYAESGDYEEAVRWQTKAIEMAPEAQKVGYRSLLALYQTGRPYHQ